MGDAGGTTAVPRAGSAAGMRAPRTAPARFPNVHLVTMGDPATGKSCLIRRFCEEVFVAKYIATIGVDYGIKAVQMPSAADSLTLVVNFWDLAGHPDFFDVRDEFYRDAQAALLVFDVQARRTYEALDGWLREAYENGLPSGSPIVLVGNKTDGVTRAVTDAEARAWASSRGIRDYFETSAATGSNVKDAFHTLLDRARKVYFPSRPPTAAAAAHVQ
eukprot:TRINITY_DN2862_c0_g1_i1.p1 TRINITY_DN2862_c0_g1~~TRINITY_DN2862_c0_g1_i1.p1  ORF type:complete len:217 (-),score=45.86 TRINITY_DN2862_c0_g1_i1:36-686(-)